MTQFFGNFQLISRSPSPQLLSHPSSQESTRTSASPLELEKRQSKESKTRRFASLPHHRPTTADAEPQRGRKGPLFTQSSGPAAAAPAPPTPLPAQPRQVPTAPSRASAGNEHRRGAADGADQPGCGASQKGSWETLTGRGTWVGESEQLQGAQVCQGVLRSAPVHLALPPSHPSDPRLPGALPPRR